MYVFLKRPEFSKYTNELGSVSPRILLTGPLGKLSALLTFSFDKVRHKFCTAPSLVTRKAVSLDLFSWFSSVMFPDVRV